MLDIKITVISGKLQIDSPFNLENKNSLESFEKLWQYFTHSQVKHMLDILGQQKFQELVNESENLTVRNIPSPITLNVSFKEITNKDKASEFVLNNFQTSPQLSEVNYLYILSYINESIKQKRS